MAAIRVDVGTDYSSYEKWFNDAKVIKHFMNCGFDLMILIIKIFTNNSQWLFVVTSFIIIFFVFKSAINEQENYELTIFFFITLSFFFSSNNGIRQWISIAMLMYSLKYVRERNLWKFLLFVAIASTFHITAVIFIPFYWILNLKLKNKTRIILLCAIIIAVVFLLADNRIFKIIKIVMPFYYARYIGDGSTLLNVKGGSIFPVLLSAGMFIYYYIFEKKLVKKIDYDYKMNISVVLVIASIVNTYNQLYVRMAAYILPLIIFLIPDAFKAFDGKFRKVVYMTMLIGSFVFMLYTLFFKNSYAPLPYNTIFSSLV